VCLDPRPPGDALPEEDSNPHSRSNNPTSFRLDDLAPSAATGSRTPGSVEGPASCPLDHRGDHASPARLERATPAFGGRCSRPLSYCELCVDDRGRTCTLRIRRPVPSPFGHVDVVRALGLEPSLVRGKSPVPYLSGVTRVVGREGIEPPMSKDGWSTASCAPWRDRPMSKPGGAGLDHDVAAVVKELVPRLVAGC
jgi:hypothetical protein